jgi:hypothetical protein
MSDPKTTARDTEARCPKCRSRSFSVSYIDACESSAPVINGQWAGVFEMSAMPVRTSAHGECARCKHSWRFRNGWID